MTLPWALWYAQLYFRTRRRNSVEFDFMVPICEVFLSKTDLPKYKSKHEKKYRFRISIKSKLSKIINKKKDVVKVSI